MSFETIELDGVTRAFGAQTALDDLDLTICARASSSRCSARRAAASRPR